MRRFAISFASSALLLALSSPITAPQKLANHKPPQAQDKYPSTLSREIHHQILMLPFFSVFDSIFFTIDGSRVTLTGQVVRRTLRDHAAAAVQSIEGVDSVVNNIEVLPVSPADDDLRRTVYRAIYEDSTLARYAVQAVPQIHIIVKNAAVSLEGSTNSELDKTLAAQRAGSVADVLSVKNNLVVQPKGSAAE